MDMLFQSDERGRGHAQNETLSACTVFGINEFMKSVGRFDEFRSCNPTISCERRVKMSIFTFVFDAALQNAQTLENKL